MSKMDDLRAMREARFEQRTGGATTPAPAARATKRPAPKRASAPTTAPVQDSATAESLCGHRAISGRTCTREQGHSEKSHRYS
jgi:hypothetical protein